MESIQTKMLQASKPAIEQENTIYKEIPNGYVS